MEDTEARLASVEEPDRHTSFSCGNNSPSNLTIDRSKQVFLLGVVREPRRNPRLGVGVVLPSFLLLSSRLWRSWCVVGNPEVRPPHKGQLLRNRRCTQ